MSSTGGLDIFCEDSEFRCGSNSCCGSDAFLVGPRVAMLLV